MTIMFRIVVAGFPSSLLFVHIFNWIIKPAFLFKSQSSKAARSRVLRARFVFRRIPSCQRLCILQPVSGLCNPAIPSLDAHITPNRLVFLVSIYTQHSPRNVQAIDRGRHRLCWRRARLHHAWRTGGQAMGSWPDAGILMVQ